MGAQVQTELSDLQTPIRKFVAACQSVEKWVRAILSSAGIDASITMDPLRWWVLQWCGGLQFKHLLGLQKRDQLQPDAHLWWVWLRGLPCNISSTNYSRLTVTLPFKLIKFLMKCGTVWIAEWMPFVTMCQSQRNWDVTGEDSAYHKEWLINLLNQKLWENVRWDPTTTKKSYSRITISITLNTYLLEDKMKTISTPEGWRGCLDTFSLSHWVYYFY